MLARFWSKVERNGPVPAEATLGRCWIWLGSRSSFGHGHLRVDSRLIPAHRLVLMFQGVEIGQDMCVLHRCDVPACVNPEHLRVGTKGDNSRDMAAKGRGIPQSDHSRAARGDRNGARLHPERMPHGIRNGNAKFTDDVVRQIRTEARAGVPLRAIARALDVSPGAIRFVVQRKHWAHVV